MEVIKEWGSNARFYLDSESGKYKLDYDNCTKTTEIELIRTGIGCIALAKDGNAPKPLLAEIGHNM